MDLNVDLSADILFKHVLKPEHKHTMQTNKIMLQHKNLCCNPESNIDDNIKNTLSVLIQA